MRVEPDYEELLKLFNKNKVKYCIIGAFAVAFYGRPRYTKDMDVLVEPSFENGRKICQALKEFGFGSLKISAENFTKKGTIIQLGYEPVRIDLMTSIEGCGLKEIWQGRKQGVYGKEKVFFIGLPQFIKNKKKSNRKQDQADLEILVKASRRRRAMQGG